MELKFHCEFWGRCRVEKCNKYAYEESARVGELLYSSGLARLWLGQPPADLNNLVPTVAKVANDDAADDDDDDADDDVRFDNDHGVGSYQSLIKVINRPCQPDGDRAHSVYVIYLQSESFQVETTTTQTTTTTDTPSATAAATRTPTPTPSMCP